MRWLLDLGETRFGQLVLWWLLASAAILAVAPFDPIPGPRSPNAATFLWWLPDAPVASPALLVAVRVWLLASAAAWARWIASPPAAWSTVAAFAVGWALRVENTANGAHVFHVTWWLLVVHAMWVQAYAGELALARDGGARLSGRLYPRWAFLLSVLCIGWFHTLAGISKLAESGTAWANGTSLQIWLTLFGDLRSPLVAPIVGSRSLASWLQATTLAIECASVLAVLGRWPRYAIGVALAGFHAGVLSTFTVGSSRVDLQACKLEYSIVSPK